MEKARLPLINLDFGIFPKASDHEETSEVGWLLYSTHQQNEERMSELISNLVQETVGAKWHPIRTNDRYRKAQEPNSTRTYALHLEAATDKAGKVQQELSKWYRSSSQLFPDGTKLRLVPPFNSILSYSHKAKYSALVAWQAALSSRICTGSTWELAANLTLDRPEPSTGITLWQIIMSIPSQVFPSTPLFHTVDRTWRSQNGITLTFHPENEAEVRAHIAGLIPFLKETANPWFMRLFTEEAKIRHFSYHWDTKTKQAYSAEEAELDIFLLGDDEMNLTEEQNIDIQIPPIATKETPAMYQDTDSVCTFHPVTPSDNS
jgi:hypothetical protein